MKKFFVKSFALAAFCLTVFASAAIAGAHSYSIYLNNKLLLQEYVNPKSITLKDLQLSQANASDMLVIYYNHCGVVGKGRSIAIKDDQGKTLKEWKFADVEGKDNGMSIPVKELLALEKSNGKNALNIYYYSSSMLPKGQGLAAIKTTTSKSTSFIQAPIKTYRSYDIGIVALMAASFNRFYI